MQRDRKELKNKLEKLIDELEKINRLVNVKSIDKAIECLKIAVKELEEFERKGLESFEHYDAKLRLLKRIGGTYYLEAEQTKLSKIGYRPDAIVIKDNEVLIVEIEKDKSRFLKKIRKLRGLYNKIIESPILINRSLKIVFGLVEMDLDDKLKEELKNLKNVEIYRITKDKIERIY